MSNKKIYSLLLILLLSTLSSYAMQLQLEEDSINYAERLFEEDELQAWVTAAKQVKIRTAKETHRIDIDGLTTLLTIKRWFQENEGMAIEHQSIRPVQPVWWTLGYLEQKAAALDDATFIRDSMHVHDTDLFELNLEINGQ